MALLDRDAIALVLAPRSVVADEPLGGTWAPVHRVTLDDGSTVVVKERRRGGAGWGYDPANLRNERAALEVLTGVDGGASAPCLVGGDVEAGVVVMTDVGRGPTLEHHLLDPSAATAAARGLVEHGRALGRLHAATASPAVAAAFVSARCAIGPYDAAMDRTRYVIHDLVQLWDEVAVHAATLGFTPPDRTRPDIAELWRELREPGPFLALTNLDASPQNCVLDASAGARIVDFEGAGMRHLGLDACTLRFPFANYGHWAVLPEDVRGDMERAYRSTLAVAVPEADDDGAYQRAMAVGCAATVILRIHRLPRIAVDDEEAHRRRTQMVSAIEVFIDAAGEAGTFPRLATWFARLGDEMRARWPEANDAPRRFPAFADRKIRGHAEERGDQHDGGPRGTARLRPAASPRAARDDAS